MGDAAHYRIRVRGCLESDDAARLRGMSIESANDDSGSPLLSVECLPDDDET